MISDCQWYLMSIAFVTPEHSLAMSHADVSQCQHGQFSATLPLNVFLCCPLYSFFNFYIVSPFPNLPSCFYVYQDVKC